MTRMSQRREVVLLLVLTVMALIVSGIGPKDRTTWWLEVAPVLIALPLLMATWRRYPLTPLLYRLIFLHALVLMLGGHYTYAEVPLGFWIQDLFDFSRNHYDRLGHFFQGFVPAMVAREILIKRLRLPGRWLFFLVCCICLAFSAVYEFIEWWAALLGGESAAAFLGTQGDVWDTQWDMFMALIGSVCSQLALSRRHDRELGSLDCVCKPTLRGGPPPS